MMKYPWKPEAICLTLLHTTIDQAPVDESVNIVGQATSSTTTSTKCSEWRIISSPRANSSTIAPPHRRRPTAARLPALICCRRPFTAAYGGITCVLMRQAIGRWFYDATAAEGSETNEPPVQSANIGFLSFRS